MDVNGEIMFSPEYGLRDLIRVKDHTVWIQQAFNRVRHYYLNPADQILRPDNGFGSLILCFSAIEYLAKLEVSIDALMQNPDDIGSARRFIGWINRHLPDYEKYGEAIYQGFRCGLVHGGQVTGAGENRRTRGTPQIRRDMTLTGTIDHNLKAIAAPHEKYKDVLVMNPSKLIDFLLAHLPKIERAILRSPDETKSYYNKLQFLHCQDIKIFQKQARSA